jgi:Flp pilus assembly protein TadD
MKKHAVVMLLMLILTGCASSPPSFESVVAAKETITPADAANMLTAADATREDGRFTEALRIYQQILADGPAMANAELGAAECMLALGKPEDARQVFAKLKSMPELHAVAVQDEGLALLALDKREAAAKSLNEASTLDPKLWRTWNALGDLADLERQPAEAQKLYAKALEINPNSASIINNIGYSKLMAGDPPGAIESFHKALGLDPHSETIQNNLRLAVAANGDYSEAIRATPHEQLPVVLNNVGYVAMQRGDYSTAEGYFAQAMTASSSYASVTAKNIEQLKSEHPVQQQ